MSLDAGAAHGRRSCIASSSSSSSSSSSLSSSLRSNRSPTSGSHRALMPSLFSHVPPTINFVLEGQKCESLSHYSHTLCQAKPEHRNLSFGPKWVITQFEIPRSLCHCLLGWPPVQFGVTLNFPHEKCTLAMQLFIEKPLITWCCYYSVYFQFVVHHSAVHEFSLVDVVCVVSGAFAEEVSSAVAMANESADANCRQVVYRPRWLSYNCQ